MFDFVERISGQAIVTIMFCFAALELFSLVIHRVLALYSDIRDISRQVRIRADGPEVTVKVDPSNEESIRALLKLLPKKAPKTGENDVGR
jgi:hypothetical protein